MSVHEMSNGEQALLADATRYYAERRTMNNPKGWAHVARAVRDMVSKGLWPEVTSAEADRVLEVIDKLAADEASLLARGWDEGVATALNHAVREPDGITLRLGKPNPYLRTDESSQS